MKIVQVTAEKVSTTKDIFSAAVQCNNSNGEKPEKRPFSEKNSLLLSSGRKNWASLNKTICFAWTEEMGYIFLLYHGLSNPWKRKKP